MNFGPARQPYPTQAPPVGSYLGKIIGGLSDLPGVPTPIRFAGGLVEDLIASGALNAPQPMTTVPTSRTYNPISMPQYTTNPRVVPTTLPQYTTNPRVVPIGMY